MVGKDQLKSARKKFLVNKVKSEIMQLNSSPFEEIDMKLEEILVPLTKVFGEKEAIGIIEGAIDAADSVVTNAINAAVKDSMKENSKG